MKTNYIIIFLTFFVNLVNAGYVYGTTAPKEKKCRHTHIHYHYDKKRRNYYDHNSVLLAYSIIFGTAFCEGVALGTSKNMRLERAAIATATLTAMIMPITGLDPDIDTLDSLFGARTIIYDTDQILPRTIFHAAGLSTG